MALSARTRWSLVAVALVGIAGVVAVVWFLGGSAPDEVDLTGLADDGSDEETDDGAGGDEAGDDEAAADEAAGDEAAGDATIDLRDLDGVWAVDTDAVAFDGEAGDGSFVGYRVDEELSTIGSTTAVGRTPAVDGEVVVDGGQVIEAEIVADLTQLTSDEGRRDQRLRSTLAPDSEARFVLSEPFAIEGLVDDGEVVEMAVSGELTIEGTTQPVDVIVQALPVDGHIVLAGSTPIQLSDYDVDAPSAPIVLSVSDDAVIEWQLYLQRTS